MTEMLGKRACNDQLLRYAQVGLGMQSQICLFIGSSVMMYEGMHAWLGLNTCYKKYLHTRSLLT